METYKDKDNNLIPYLLCWFDGKIKKSYWIKDYKDNPTLLGGGFNLLVENVVKDLCIKKYRNYKIYLHNFSRFDGIFLLKALTNIENGIVEPIIQDGKLINISFNYNEITIHFRDSYLLLFLFLF